MSGKAMWQIIISGPGYFDTSYDLPEGVTSLGRADENDIVLGGDLVSRRHIRLYVEGDVLRIEDLGSRNGSRVNGVPLQGSRQLSPGDMVALGENTLSVRQPNTVESAATEMVVDLGVGGVVRFGHGQDVGPSVLLARNVKDADIRRLLDNAGAGSDDTFSSDAPVPSTASSRVGQETLGLLLRTVEALASATTLSGFLDATMDRLLERTDATTAVVLLRHSSGAMVPAAVRHRGQLANGEVPVSDAIVDEALRQGRALAVDDVRDDRRFASSKSVILYGVDRVLCIPIGAEPPYAGVLYVNTAAKGDTRLEVMLDVCTAVAHLVATGVQKFGPRDSSPTAERLTRTLERFHPPDVAERRAAEAQRQGGRLPGLEEHDVTVLHAELVDFTALAGKLGAQRASLLLNEFHSRMTGIVFSFEATVEGFLGESMRALFGVPYAKGEDSVRAVRAALALRADWERAMSRHPQDERCALRIALHSTRALVGMIGNEARSDYTVVGEGVGVAGWLAATGSPGQVLITSKVLASVGARFDVQPLGKRLLRPPKEPMAAFEVIEEDGGQLTSPGVR